MSYTLLLQGPLEQVQLVVMTLVSKRVLVERRTVSAIWRVVDRVKQICALFLLYATLCDKKLVENDKRKLYDSGGTAEKALGPICCVFILCQIVLSLPLWESQLDTELG